MRLLPGLLAKLLPTPMLPIHALREGMKASVRGHVVPRDLMDSPLNGAPCVYYRYVVEQWQHSRVAGVGGDGFWNSVERDEAILEFYLADGDDQVIVAPHDVRVRRKGKVEDPPIELTIQRRAQQLLLEAGDFIEVTGAVAVAEDLFDENRGYRDVATRLMLCAPSGGELRIRLLEKRSDHPPG